MGSLKENLKLTASEAWNDFWESLLWLISSNKQRREFSETKTLRSACQLTPLDHNPLYFVMPFFEYGDMGCIAPHIRQDIPAQEQYFNRMIDCVDVLHQRGILHRDIKPQSFLVGQNSLVVSDLGLCTEIGSVTGFTNTSSAWGTDGYRPPEHWEGGFKNADVAGDVFMLGKTFYVTISGRTPSYMTANNIPPAIFAILERCCAPAKSSRYKSLTALRQSLTLAYNMLYPSQLPN